MTNTMHPLTKVGFVIAGYVIAAAVAAAAVASHLLAIGGPFSPTYSGMNAFGDSLLFLAVFGVVAILPTSAALYFLRSYRAFWRRFSVVALVVALTSLAAFIVVSIDSRSVIAGLAFPRILVAPLFALAFGLSGLFSPDRAPRIALFVATVIEITGFACWLGTCIIRNL